MTDLPTNIISFIRELYSEPDAFIPLHAPVFRGKEKEYLNNCIDSTFVSSVGEYVNQFERQMAELSGAQYAVAIANGTLALQLALELAGVRRDELVLTQALTFVATANAIHHVGAEPLFLDVDRQALGLSVEAVKRFLAQECESSPGKIIHRASGRRVAACVPMHTLGFICEIESIVDICDQYGLPVVEDAAEALGSYRVREGGRLQHAGTFGLLGVFSLNGNKIITSGGGGCIVTDDELLARRAKHLSTTAKLSPAQDPSVKAYEFVHDEPGYNYRLTNLAAALACAQLEQLPDFLTDKRNTAQCYQDFLATGEPKFLTEPAGQQANYWLQSVLFDDPQTQQEFLEQSNTAGIMTRPLWRPLHLLPMYQRCIHDDLGNTQYLAQRVVSLPSSVRRTFS